MRFTGSCHCGNIAFFLDVDAATTQLPARVCDCSFCVKHGGVWTALPNSVLTLTVTDPALVHPYSFATRTAQFHVCRVCGAVPYVTSTIASREYAVINVNCLEDVAPSMLNRVPASFDGEGEGARLERRTQHWIADVRHRKRTD